jgi:hypothetical protein
VERHVFSTMANLFNLDVDVIFYDTTSASFAIDEAVSTSNVRDGIRAGSDHVA